ncbi:MAG: hypothetical protein ACKO1L_08380 [Brachymonas sp.]
MRHMFTPRLCVQALLAALLLSNFPAWATDAPKLNPNAALTANPALGKDLQIKLHKPDLRIAGVKIDGANLVIQIANDCLADAPSSRIKVTVSGPPTAAKPMPHAVIGTMEGDVAAIKAGGSTSKSFSKEGLTGLNAWQGKSFKIEVNSNGKVAEVSTANNSFIRPESGPDQAAFPLAKTACAAQ